MGAAAPGGLIPNHRILFQEKRREAVDTGGEVLRAIETELARGNKSQLETTWQRLESLFDVVQLSDECLRLLARTEGEPTAGPAERAVPEYVVSPWFLADCAAYLLSDPRRFELLHVVAGLKVAENQRTLDRMMPVELAEQSDTHATANQQDLQRTLLECSERWGHSIHGLFHSHPGTGPLCTRPSSIDLATHERWERGYPLVGMICVRDGFVRFFSHSRPFTVRLYGKRVVQHEEHLFQITDLPRHLSQPDAWAEPAGRGERH